MGGSEMIFDSIEFIRKVLVNYLQVADDQVILNAARVLVTDSNKLGCYISVVNLEEEAALRNLPHTERRLGQLMRVEPPVHLNLYLLFAFEFQTYEASITHLGKTIELFQSHRFFGPETQTAPVGPGPIHLPGEVQFPVGLERLIFEMVNMNFEALNNLWGILGGSHFPSVVYKVRMVRIEANASAPEPEITTIQLDVVAR